LVAALTPKDVQESLVACPFALDGTKDISGVTILIPRSDPLSTAPHGYASLDNSTRKYNQALTLQPKSSSGYPIFQGTPFAYSSLDAADLVLDILSGEVAVYKSDAVLLPYNMDALAAYAGATTSIFNLLSLVGLALSALLLV
ncbi:hypothetical protein CLOM_g3612, partial [Closterium sp. NIES-68]